MNGEGRRHSAPRTSTNHRPEGYTAEAGGPRRQELVAAVAALVAIDGVRCHRMVRLEAADRARRARSALRDAPPEEIRDIIVVGTAVGTFLADVREARLAS